VSVICADLLELELPNPVDVVVSTATFHWILDHDALFARMRTLVRDGGQFVAQCGGRGNIAKVQAIARKLAEQPPYHERLAAMPEIWNYADVEETRERLERAGFEVSACWIAAAPTSPPRPREFLSTVILAPYLEHLPGELHDGFLDSALEQLGEPVVLDYQRLNWDATAR
jgi:trans-aconitate 2-methyltransferase